MPNATTEKSAQNIQDSFLNNARKEKSLVTIYLLGGVRLNGRIKSFDKYSLILETSTQEHLVFKHAISTVLCGRTPASQNGPVHSQPVGVGRMEAGAEAGTEGTEG